MNERRITRRAAGQRRQGKTDWERVERLSEEEIAAAATEDEDNLVWTEAELRSAELVLPSGEPKVPATGSWLELTADGGAVFVFLKQPAT